MNSTESGRIHNAEFMDKVETKLGQSEIWPTFTAFSWTQDQSRLNSGVHLPNSTKLQLRQSELCRAFPEFNKIATQAMNMYHARQS